jgi:hypothetical protein
MDKGLRFILECCRTLFNYAAKRRRLSPYAENPFAVLEIDHKDRQSSEAVNRKQNRSRAAVHRSKKHEPWPRACLLLFNHAVSLQTASRSQRHLQTDNSTGQE